MSESMDRLIGTWTATKKVHTQMGVSAFTIPEGATIEVTQVDAEVRKVLVDAGNRKIDWKGVTFLNDFHPMN